MANKIVVYWRDIPSQVNVKQGRKTGKALLAQRFHEGIDRAAMRAGMSDTDSYVQEWRRETEEVEAQDDIDAQARAYADVLEAEFSESVLDAVVENKGLRPSF